MHILFLLAIAISVSYILFAKRNVDFFTVAIFSGFFYFMPAIVGYAYNPYLDKLDALVNAQYTIMVVYLMSFLTGAFIKDRYFTSSILTANNIVDKPDKYTTYANIALFSLCSIAFVYILFSLGSSAFFVYKALLLNQLGVMFSILCGCCLVGIVFAYKRSWLLFALSALGIAYLLIVGYRFLFILAFLSLFMLYASRQGKQYLLLHNWKLALLILLVGSSLLANRFIADQFVKDSPNRLQLNTALIHAEPMVIQENLNLTLKNNLQVPPNYLYKNMAVMLVPFSSKLGYQTTGFNQFIQPFYFDYPYGVANNIFAEMYALGGFPFVYGFIILLALLCFAFSLKLTRCNQNIQALLIPIGIIIFFYIHRNDLTYTINLIRNIALIWLLINAVAFSLTKLSSPVRKKDEN